ncbi:MAG: CDP-alcohol phosphatidyltransferase family protein [Calditrichaeota bacterium]|nr:MAG: CDP-alcohol phosphatidyltransferase family protein [Calditrichota bacterium]
MKLNFLSDSLKNWYLRFTQPLVNIFIELELNPNFFTSIGFIVSIIAAYMFSQGNLRFAGVLVLLSGTFDIIDGRVARATKRETKFGALYDSTLDRYAEVIMFFGLAYYFIFQAWTGAMNEVIAFIAAVSVNIALGGSVMVSYVRARAEALGFNCSVGYMQRPERIVYIGFSAIFQKYILILAIILIAIMANYTAMQRLYHIWDQERREKLAQQQVDSETETL